MDNIQLRNYSKVLANFQNGDSFADKLLIESQDNISIYFSPFDYINKNAKFVLVGISPGLTQANNANAKACELINSGISINAVSKEAKQTGAFSGTLRNNLVRLLDYIGIHNKLSISGSESLFDEDQHLLHSTSVFRYPTLLNGKPISSANKALRVPLLKSMVDNYLVDEFKQLADSVFYLPMGQGVDKVLLYLCERGILSRNQILIGLPHPSGANAERISYFLDKKQKSALSSKTNAEKIDDAKKKLLSQLNVT